MRLVNKDMFSTSANFSINFTGDNIRTATSYLGNKELYVLVNFALKEGSSTVPFRLADADAYHILSQSEGPEPTINVASRTVTVPANGYVVIGTKDLVSDVQEIPTMEEYSFDVYADNGTLVVRGAKSLVEVWNLSGVKVAEGNGNFETALPEGIYIVRSGANSVKVLVK